MSKGNVMIAREDYGYIIKIEGRVNLECSPPLKNFSDNLVSGNVPKIILDLASCAWMDSTFMGILAILGLKSRKLDIAVEIRNADQKITGLIKDLGIESLFKFMTEQSPLVNAEWENVTETQKNDDKTLSETILKAHETLVETNSSNAPKFEKVIDLLKKDIEKESEA